TTHLLGAIPDSVRRIRDRAETWRPPSARTGGTGRRYAPWRRTAAEREVATSLDSTYLDDVSVRYIDSRYSVSGIVQPGRAREAQWEASGCGERSPVGSTRAGRARPAARDPHARLRTPQAAERLPRRVPRLWLRLALPLPQGTTRPGPDRGGGARHPGQPAGGPPVEDRLPADRGGQGAAWAAPCRAGCRRAAGGWRDGTAVPAARRQRHLRGHFRELIGRRRPRGAAGKEQEQSSWVRYE